MSDRSKPSLTLSDTGVVTLVTPTDGGCGDNDLTRLGHITADLDVPAELEADLAALLDEWQDGLTFARGCRMAVNAAYLDHVGSPR